MRGKSHIYLGQYLMDHYMEDVCSIHQKLFLLGCIQPDKNPLTYLKGSFRCQWLRGHNYRNARRFMHRISMRLEKRENLGALDFYTLGKLIHYTADAFTSAHNESFPEKLSDHRAYEIELQEQFLSYLKQNPEINIRNARSIMEGIRNYHRAYSRQNCDIHTDCVFALHACCCVLAVLFSRNTL